VIEVAVAGYLTTWHRLVLGPRVIIEGEVHPDHAGPSPELGALLARWPGHYYWQRDSGRAVARLVLVQEAPRPAERWWLHALLMALTFMTVSLAGDALLTGMILPLGAFTPAAIARGLPFSLPLLAIMGAHELGHYAVARRYRVDASPPFFIPFPAILSVVGTLGAFIRLRSPVFDRRTLFDIGAAGPLAGMLVALPVLAIGLAMSPAAPASLVVPEFGPLLVANGGGEQLFLGDSPIVWLVRRLVSAPHAVVMHPVAVAGWLGVLLTMLNLLPASQFDGGHVVFAMFGRAQAWLARAVWVALLALGWFTWHGWLIWAALALIVGRGRLAHPRVLSAEWPLDRRRMLVGWLVLLLLVLCFTPLPVSVR